MVYKWIDRMCTCGAYAVFNVAFSVKDQAALGGLWTCRRSTESQRIPWCQVLLASGLQMAAANLPDTFAAALASGDLRVLK